MVFFPPGMAFSLTRWGSQMCGNLDLLNGISVHSYFLHRKWKICNVNIRLDWTDKPTCLIHWQFTLKESYFIFTSTSASTTYQYVTSKTNGEDQGEQQEGHSEWNSKDGGSVRDKIIRDTPKLMYSSSLYACYILHLTWTSNLSIALLCHC